MAFAFDELFIGPRFARVNNRLEFVKSQAFSVLGASVLLSGSGRVLLPWGHIVPRLRSGS